MLQAKIDKISKIYIRRERAIYSMPANVKLENIYTKINLMLFVGKRT